MLLFLLVSEKKVVAEAKMLCTGEKMPRQEREEGEPFLNCLKGSRKYVSTLKERSFVLFGCLAVLLFCFRRARRGTKVDTLFYGIFRDMVVSKLSFLAFLFSRVQPSFSVFSRRVGFFSS